jgi:hypothetical protein
MVYLMSRFTSIIYFMQDPNLLVTTVDAVRRMDADRSAEELQKLGIPISTACKVCIWLKHGGLQTQMV